MDTEKILLAIEEQKRWEERAVDVKKQLEDLDKKKKMLIAEMKTVDEKLRYYGTLADSFREYNVAKSSGKYYIEGTKHIR